MPAPQRVPALPQLSRRTSAPLPLCARAVSYTPGPYEKWNLISNVQGCDCCLGSTDSVSSCFLKTRDCGPGLCNCNARNASCVFSQPPLEAILAEWEANATCAAEPCSAAFLQRVEGSEEVLAASQLQPLCDGSVGLTYGKVGATPGVREGGVDGGRRRNAVLPFCSVWLGRERYGMCEGSPSLHGWCWQG